MAAKNSGSELEAQPMDSDSPAGFDIEFKLHELNGKGPVVFDDWISLISRIERAFPDNIEKICLVYDSFLSEFPLCHGYWRKYADHKIRLCTVDEVVEVFERAVQSATYSVGVWVDYCYFSMSAFEDPSDICRLFKRGMSYVGKDYSCHALWDKYIQFELSQQQWSLLAHIYVEALRFPTKKLHNYYDSFKKLAALCDKELGCQSNCFMDSPSHSLLDGEVPKSGGADEISCVVKELFEPSLSFDKSKLLLQKYLTIGECLYQEACQLDEKIRTFETKIRRSYFHVKPLDADQLDNWHHYLDFVEKQGDFDWVVKLYERCLIPCAHYPEFWMRYVDFMETKGGREIANYALDRATQVFLKRVPVILLFNARFKEHEGNATAARSTLLQCDDVELDLNFIENIVIKANMEKRLGNFVAASNIFEEALAMAAEKKKLHGLPNIYVHFSRLKYMIESADAARDVLLDGIKRLPNCKLLLEELINFAILNGGWQHIPVLDSVIQKAISPGPDMSQCLNVKDAEDVSSLYLKFIDLCGTIHELRKAWDRHIRLFPYSVRTAFTEQITTNIKSSKLAKEEKDDAIVTEHQQPSRDCNPDGLVKLPLGDKKISRLENYDSGSDQDSTNYISEQKVPVGENDDIQFEQAHTNQFQSGEADSDAPKGVILSSLEVSEQLMKDVPETNVSLLSPEASEQPREDNTKCGVVEGTESEQALKEHSGGNDIKQKCDHEPKKDTKMPSLDSLSLHARDNTSIDSHPSVSPACEAPQETRNFDGHMLESNQHNPFEGSLTCSQRKTNSSDSPRTEIEVVNISPSSSHQSPILTGPPHQRIQANSSGNRHQMNNSGKFRRESKFGSRGHLQRRSYQHQRQVSPLQHLRAEPGGPMPTSQGYPSQVASPHSPQSQQGSQAQHQYQATCPASVTPPPPSTWPSQFMQQPNSIAPSQAMQSSGDHGMQNSQAFNQMWQHYYYQQQLFQQQQQPLQQQQHLHLSQQYPQQQIQLQQQYYSHPQQQQPYQQLQLQQQQYNPQQQQQYLPQQQQEFYQQPQQQQQQHQLYRQHVEQQPPPLPPQQQIEHEQHQQQSNYNYYQQNASLAHNGTNQSGPEPASCIVASQVSASVQHAFQLTLTHQLKKQGSGYGPLDCRKDQEIPPADAREP